MGWVFLTFLPLYASGATVHRSATTGSGLKTLGRVYLNHAPFGERCGTDAGTSTDLSRFHSNQTNASTSPGGVGDHFDAISRTFLALRVIDKPLIPCCSLT